MDKHGNHLLFRQNIFVLTYSYILFVLACAEYNDVTGNTFIFDIWSLFAMKNNVKRSFKGETCHFLTNDFIF